MIPPFFTLLAQATSPAPTPPPDLRTPSGVVAAAPAADWRAIAADDLLVIDLAADGAGRARRVIIQLAPSEIADAWVANVRTLARAHWWDGTSVNRVQDNYVAQWGDATERKPLPAGMVATREQDYVVRRELGSLGAPIVKAMGPQNTINFYETFYRGFPVAIAGTPDSAASWPTHCYGAVGVGRNGSPDAGTGAELYAVIGHAPRQLDRNIALVGRVIEGIEHLSSLPRGTGALGFYEQPAQRVPIVRARLAADLPATERPRFDYLGTDSASFLRYATLRANRKDDFYIAPAGRVDVCNVPVPVRRTP